MNIYDFDGTIYKGDSTLDFYKFELKRHPSMTRHIPAFAVSTLKHKTGRINTTEWKTVFFRFLSDIKDINSEIELFWKKHYSKIFEWYKSQRNEDDVIISASPEFLLKIPCQKLGVGTLIASCVDPETGTFSGLNCKGEEKVRRFRKLFPEAEVQEFYSDSVSDLPMAKLADKAFLVINGEVTPWNI